MLLRKVDQLLLPASDFFDLPLGATDGGGFSDFLLGATDGGGASDLALLGAADFLLGAADGGGRVGHGWRILQPCWQPFS